MKIETRSTITAFGITFCGCLVAAFTASAEAYRNPVVWMVMLATAAGAAFKDNRSSYRIPPPETDPGPPGKGTGALSLVGLLGLIGLLGCATVDPNADVLVVRTEQSLSTANATFDFVLRVDQGNRPFWRTNAPAFHQFCEWLRTPQSYGVSTVPRAVVLQLNVDDLKLAYKQSKTAGNSNALYTAWAVLNQAVLQSTSWSNIVTTPTHP